MSGKVIAIRPPVEDDERPPVSSDPRVVRWLLPSGIPGVSYAHAAIVGAELTVCRGHHVVGAIYPPSPDLPRCPACLEVVSAHVDPGDL